jgi:hypothetical protein
VLEDGGQVGKHVHRRPDGVGSHENSTTGDARPGTEGPPSEWRSDKLHGQTGAATRVNKLVQRQATWGHRGAKDNKKDLKVKKMDHG